MVMPLSAYIHRTILTDLDGIQTENVNQVANLVWDSVGLAWVKETQGGGGGGGGSVTQGTVPWISDEYQLSLRFDAAASPILYLGQAAPGASESSAVWRIQQIDVTSGVSMKWASGASTFTQQWSNRASLSYS